MGFLGKILKSDRLALLAFALACIVAAYGIGAATVHFRLFPYPQIISATKDFLEAVNYRQERLLWSLYRSDETQTAKVHAADRMAPGLTLVSGFTNSDTHLARVIDETGRAVQTWRLNWDELWPDATHLPEKIMARDQKHPHGMRILENGDLVFNFTELGMMRIDACNRPVWRLEERTHHSIDFDRDGNMWVPSVETRTEPTPKYPDHAPEFEEFFALKVSRDGKLLKKISINELLLANGMTGLLYLSSLDELTPFVTGDTLHLNDLDVFPDTMEEGVFKPGDIMASLRNINTVVVFDPETLKIRFINTGSVMRQHDPDFVDGNTISIFENNNLQSDWFDNISGTRNLAGQASRIVTLSALDGTVTDRFDGGEGGPFFTDLMGNHQRLSNGNMLIVEARAGRAFETDSQGRLVWEFFNIAEPGLLGAITYAERLPVEMDETFFTRAQARCAQ